MGVIALKIWRPDAAGGTEEEYFKPPASRGVPPQRAGGVWKTPSVTAFGGDSSL